jgi:hypothetical protein
MTEDHKKFIETYSKLIEEKDRQLSEIFHQGRLVGALDTLLDLMENTAIDDKIRRPAVLAVFVSILRKIKGLEDKARLIDELAADKEAFSDSAILWKPSRRRRMRS